jgi:hypothetical protein
MMLFRNLSRQDAPTLSYQITERLRILEILSLTPNTQGEKETKHNEPCRHSNHRKHVNRTVASKKQKVVSINQTSSPFLVRLQRGTDYVWHPVKTKSPRGKK